jgi:hypothetical protein
MVDVAKVTGDFPDLDPVEALFEVVMRPKTEYLRYFKRKEFTSYFDGAQAQTPPKKGVWGNYVIWADVIRATAECVDGNAMRFVKEAPTDQVSTDLPPKVLEELAAYTQTFGGKLSTATKAWLQENCPPPYSSVKVYRGITIKGETVQEANASVQAFLGLPTVLDVHKGSDVVLKRGKASSWTTTPQISREFANLGGMLQVMVQAELKPKQIAVDLNLLPLSARMKLRQFSQNEVIAAPGKIPAKILSVGLGKSLASMLAGTASARADQAWQEYAWVPRYGLVKKTL